MKNFKRVLLIGSVIATGMLAAGEIAPQDERNAIEKGTQTTTEVIKTGVHATTETVMYVPRFASWLLSETARLTTKGINWFGEKTKIEPFTDALSKTVAFLPNTASITIDGTANILQGATEYPFEMLDTMTNAGATATRDAKEGLKQLGKGSLFNTVGLFNVLSTNSTSLLNLTVTGAEDLARTTFVGGAEMTAKTVSVVDQKTGRKMQENIDAMNGVMIAGETAAFLTRAMALNAPMIATNLPLINENIKKEIVSEAKKAVEKVSEGEELPKTEGPFGKVVDETVKDIRDMSTNGTTMNAIIAFFARFGRRTKAAEKEALNTPTPLPRYNPLKRNGGMDR